MREEREGREGKEDKLPFHYVARTTKEEEEGEGEGGRPLDLREAEGGRRVNNHYSSPRTCHAQSHPRTLSRQQQQGRGTNLRDLEQGVKNACITTLPALQTS